MSDSPESSGPGSREVEEAVARAVSERIDPLHTQLKAVARALAILAGRVAGPQQLEALTSQVDTLARQVEDALVTISSIHGRLEEVPAAVADALDDAPAGHGERLGPQVDELRITLVRAVDEAAARLEASTSEEVAGLAERVRSLEASVRTRITAGPNEDVAGLAERLSSLEASVRAGVEGREAQTDALRQALAVAVSHAVAKLDQARGFDSTRLLERIDHLEGAIRSDGDLRASLTAAVEQAVERVVTQVEARHVASAERVLEQVDGLAREAVARQLDDLRTGLAERLDQVVAHVDAARGGDGATIERSLAEMEAARAADAARVLEQVAALKGPLDRDAIARGAQVDDLRHTVVTSIDQAFSLIETARAADVARLLAGIDELAARGDNDAKRRDEQAAALLAAFDERLEALHFAGAQASEERDRRLAAHLEASTAEHGRMLLARLDERTASITELSAIPPMVAAEVRNATAAALSAQVEPLVAKLVEAVDSLAHEGGRIEAMARSHAGEARAGEERVAAMFVGVAERAESAVDRSRARIAEGQVALGGRFEATVGELMAAVNAATERLEVRLIESAEGLRTAGGHQNGALLDAVNRGSQQIGEKLADLRAVLFAGGTEAVAREAEADRRMEALADRIEGLGSRIEALRHDPRLEALVVEQVAAREAQMAALEAVAARIDEVGPLVARALLSEVERAVRAANAAEEAVSSLRPEALRAELTKAGDHAAEEVLSATRRFDRAIAALSDQIGQQLAALADGQARARDELAEIVRSPDRSAARLDELDRSLAEALGELGAVVASTRDELMVLTGRALDRSAAVADEVARTNGAAIEDLRASQRVLREAVEDGAHKAELAALDIRGLRDRLTPHLVALAEATTRRAEADHAGFDAVLARLDQLLATRVR